MKVATRVESGVGRQVISIPLRSPALVSYRLIPVVVSYVKHSGRYCYLDADIMPKFITDLSNEQVELVLQRAASALEQGCWDEVPQPPLDTR